MARAESDGGIGNSQSAGDLERVGEHQMEGQAHRGWVEFIARHLGEQNILSNGG
jgi:hypothetical protein